MSGLGGKGRKGGRGGKKRVRKDREEGKERKSREKRKKGVEGRGKREELVSPSKHHMLSLHCEQTRGSRQTAERLHGRGLSRENLQHMRTKVFPCFLEALSDYKMKRDIFEEKGR